MNPLSQPRMRACLSFLLFFLIGNTVYAQVPASLPGYVSVDETFITAGKTHFRKVIKRMDRKHMTGQITVSYATLKELVDKAGPTDEFVFTIVGIDKNDSNDQKVWGPILGVTDIKDFNKHQGLVLGIRPPMPKADSKQGSGGAPFAAGSYYALGSLCPPPVCPGY